MPFWFAGAFPNLTCAEDWLCLCFIFVLHSAHELTFFIYYLRFCIINLQPKQQTKIWYFPPCFSPSNFSWTFLIAYLRADRKNNGHKTSACFWALWFTLLISCLCVIECHVLTGRIIECHVLTGRIIECHVLTGCIIECHVLTGHIIECHVLTGRTNKCTFIDMFSHI